jgi:hypothetical protein
MSKDDKVKNYCYSAKCGPVAYGGFHLEKYPVCKFCKEEITERLANDIKNREGKNSKDLSQEELWQTMYGKLPNGGEDDGFY